VIAFIREHEDQRVVGSDGVAGLRWGVEPMCTVLTEHGIPVAPATYYEWACKQPTRQQLRDEQVTALIRAEREDPKTGKFASALGSRKMWLRLRGKGHDVARCTVERLMRAQGWKGTRDELHEAIVFWTEHTYNRRRRQRTLGKLTPVEFELAFTNQAAAVAA
jgi:putative transposase